MARDTALLEAHRPGDDPILRIYRWDPPTVTIGYNQDPAGFDREAVAAAGFGLVRRATGGRAILAINSGVLGNSSRAPDLQDVNPALAEMCYLASTLNFWPPTAASYIKPPFSCVKMAMPSLKEASAEAPDFTATAEA